MALRLWCVRANSGTFTQHFVAGGYAGIGWTNLARDLNEFESLDELKLAYRASHPDVRSNLVVGMQSGQVWRFFAEVLAGDFVVTPEVQSRWLRFGRVAQDPSYYYEAAPTDGCRYPHRRRVAWSDKRIDRTELSVPFQSALRSMLTVYELTHLDEFLTSIGRRDLIEHVVDTQGGQAYDAYAVVLDRIRSANVVAGEAEVVRERIQEERRVAREKALAERERTVVVLTYFREAPTAEIAQSLGIADGNVRIVRHRAMKSLRACMEPPGPDAQERRAS